MASLIEKIRSLNKPLEQEIKKIEQEIKKTEQKLKKGLKYVSNLSGFDRYIRKQLTILLSTSEINTNKDLFVFLKNLDSNFSSYYHLELNKQKDLVQETKKSLENISLRLPIEEKEIDSISDLIEVVKFLNKKWKGIWFRGQSKFKWDLNPSLFRKDNKTVGDSTKENESNFLRRFQQLSVSFLDIRPTEEWEWLFLMQHYAVPTRLLDWSESPLVAMYFSIYGMQEEIKESDGAIWCLNPYELNKLANVHKLPSFGVDPELKGYLNSELDLPETRKPIGFLAQRQFARLQSQQGVFVIHQKETLSLDQAFINPLIKLKIKRSSKKKLAEELKALAFDKLSLFPELEHVGKIVKNRSRGNK